MGRPVTSDGGRIGFLSGLDDGGAWLFNGLSLTGNRLIGMTDLLDGKPISLLNLDDITDSGRILFEAHLDGGAIRALYRADALPTATGSTGTSSTTRRIGTSMRRTTVENLDSALAARRHQPHRARHRRGRCDAHAHRPPVR